MSTHNIGFYEDISKIIIKYHQIRTLFLLMHVYNRSSHDELMTICCLRFLKKICTCICVYKFAVGAFRVIRGLIAKLF